MNLLKPGRILIAGRVLLDGTVEGVLQDLVRDDYGNQILVWVDMMVVPGIGRNLFLVMVAAKKSIVIIVNYEKSRLAGINATLPLRSESNDLYSFGVNLSANGYGTKELAMNAVGNAQVWHRRLGHLHLPSPVDASPADPLPGAAGGPSSGGASPSSGRGASPKTRSFRRPPCPP